MTITTTARTHPDTAYKVVISGVPPSSRLQRHLPGRRRDPRRSSPTSTRRPGWPTPVGGTVHLPPQPNLARAGTTGAPSTARATRPCSAAGRLHRRDDERHQAGSPSRPSTWRSTPRTTTGSDHKAAMMHDHLDIFLRGVHDSAAESRTPSTAIRCCPAATTATCGRTTWSPIRWPTSYPGAKGSGATRRRTTSSRGCCATTCWSPGPPLTSPGTAHLPGRLVRRVDGQPLRGIAWNALSAGVDHRAPRSPRSTPHRPPGATGWCWGADVVEVPCGDDATFVPATTPSRAPCDCTGGVVDGIDAPSTGTAWRSRASTSTRPSAACCSSGVTAADGGGPVREHDGRRPCRSAR